jgi:hypothetical protein
LIDAARTLTDRAVLMELYSTGMREVRRDPLLKLGARRC